MLELSDGENYFIINSIDDGMRIDGRDTLDYRPINVEIGIINNANGSARLRLGNSEVIVVVKSELQSINEIINNQRQIEFNLNCSAIANPMFQGKGVDDFAEEINAHLEDIYNSNLSFDTNQLVILKNRFSWTLFVDILVLEFGGNLFDIVALAVKSALFNTKLPSIKVSYEEDMKKPYIELSENLLDGLNLNIDNIPCLVTIFKIGSSHVVDASMEEESCAIASLICSISPGGKLLATKKVGGGSLNPISIQNMIKTATQIGLELNEALMGILHHKMAQNKSSF